MNRAEVAAVLLALGAALVSAIGDVIRQRSAHEIVDKPVGASELFRLSLRDTRWWLGGAAAVAQLRAAGGGAEPGVGDVGDGAAGDGLLFALPINARITHRRVSRWDWLWAALLAGAVAVILAVGNPTSDQQRATLETWAVVAGDGSGFGVLRAGRPNVGGRGRPQCCWQWLRVRRWRCSRC